MEDRGASRISRLPQAPSQTSQQQQQQSGPAVARPAVARPAKLHGSTLIPRPASPAEPLQRSAKDAAHPMRSSTETAVGRQLFASPKGLGTLAGGRSKEQPSILQPRQPIVPKISMAKVQLAAERGGLARGTGNQLPAPEACASPCRHRQADDGSTVDRGSPSQQPNHQSTDNISRAAARTLATSSSTLARSKLLGGRPSAEGTVHSPVRPTEPSQRPSQSAPQPRVALAIAEDEVLSPSPGVRKSLSHAPTGADARQRAASVDKAAKAASLLHPDTRASFLRRSASAEKRNVAASASSTGYTNYKRNVSTSVRSSTATNTSSAFNSRTPHPPENPRSTAPNIAARHRMLGSPPPASLPANRASEVRGSTASPSRRASTSGISAPAKAVPFVKHSILSGIPEKLGKASGMQPHHAAAPTSAPGLHLGTKSAAPGRPTVGLSLDLSAVTRVAEPLVTPEHTHELQMVAAPAPAPFVPKLDFAGLNQQAAAEQSVGDAYVVTPEELLTQPARKSGPGSAGAVKKPPPPAPPPDHFYFYGRLDPADERRTMESLNRMPKTEQKHWKKIFTESIQAKQNCEAIAFRGHRLLDQMNSHHKETLETREKLASEEITRLRQAYEEAQNEVQRMRDELERQRAQGQGEGLAAPGGGGGRALAASMANMDLHSTPSYEPQPRRASVSPEVRSLTPPRAGTSGAGPLQALQQEEGGLQQQGQQQDSDRTVVARMCQQQLDTGRQQMDMAADVIQRSVRRSLGGDIASMDIITGRAQQHPQQQHNNSAAGGRATAAGSASQAPVPVGSRLAAALQQRKAAAAAATDAGGRGQQGRDGSPGVKGMAMGGVAADVVAWGEDDQDQLDGGLGGVLEQLSKDIRVGRATDDLLPHQDAL